MNKLLAGLAVVVLVLAGVTAYSSHSKVTVVNPPVGAAASPDHYNQENFYNGLTYNRISSTALATASTSPVVLGAASAGFIAIPKDTTTFIASSTAITANSYVRLTQISTSTGATTLNSAFLTTLGTAQCNTTNATSTPIVSIFASSTNTSLSGFKITLGTGPTTNPQCYAWSVAGF